MDIKWRPMLWAQFGAAIDMLDNALASCPDVLWRQPVWPNPPEQQDQPQRAEFWIISFHALFWLDLYLHGSEEGFVPPAPFHPVPPEDLDDPSIIQPYTQEQLRGYLAELRQKCQITIETMTDERARQPANFPWMERVNLSYLELQMYSMRHVQEHAAQLSLLLGQHGVPGEQLDWVPRVREDAD